MKSSLITKKIAGGLGAILIASFVLWVLLELLTFAGSRDGFPATQPLSDARDDAGSLGTGALTPSLTLNEVMIDNRSVISDQAGDFDPWIELYNAGWLPLDVGSMALIVGDSSPLSPTQWLIPADTVIPSHDHLLIWADGEPGEGPLHTNFVLTAGQVISLHDKSLFDAALIDHLTLSSTLPDWSWARHPNGDGPWTSFDRPSPGGLNATHWAYLPSVARGSVDTQTTVLLNEFMAANDSTISDQAGEYDDWIELYNPGPDEVNVGGMYLSDDLGNLPRWRIPPGTVITAGGYLLLWADGQEDQGTLHTNFKLSRDGETLMLVQADGHSLLDTISFSAQQDDVSFGRLPDGTDSWRFLTTPTPGGPNALISIDVSDTAHHPVTPGVSDTVTVTTRVVGAYPPLTVTLFYDVGDGFTRTAMLDDGLHGDGGADDDLFGAQLPPQPARSVISYYVQVHDDLSQTVTDPEDAPRAVYRYAVDLPLGTLVINEFMAANGNTIVDEDNDADDWIELYNMAPITQDLGGFYLTDDLNQPTRWQIPPSTTLPPGGFLLIWADDEPLEGPLHANFKLGAVGEALGLFGSDGSTAIDALTYPVQFQDISYGRYPNGTGPWTPLVDPTPGYTNALSTAPFISGVVHSPTVPLSDTVVTVTALITDDGAVTSATLNYDVGEGMTQTLMWDDGLHGDRAADDGIFGAQIPPQPDRAVIYYFIQAQDGSGLTRVAPLSAPDQLYRYVVGDEALPLYVNEFMASNSSVIRDDAGEFDDWIELYNGAPTPIRLGGMYLSDDLANSTTWQIPHGVTVPPGGFVLFWADRDTGQGDHHAGFKLNAGGEDVGLFDTPLHGNDLIDGLAGYPPQSTDQSYGRSGDGGPTWRTFTLPTPGDSNPL